MLVCGFINEELRMSIELSPNEAAAWDSYAAAALSVAVIDAENPGKAVDVAADIADRMLLQRQERIRAYNAFKPNL
jgi:hypothetical protein